MTKTEIEEKIKNGESAWVVDEKENKIEELHFYKNNIYEFDKNDLFINKFWIYEFRKLFKTKSEAKHYLHHANITRTETLPFLTWEEFLKEIKLKFIACDGVSNMTLYYCDNTIYLVDDEYPEFNTTSWELTEENFYKAYDECVRMFRGEE